MTLLVLHGTKLDRTQDISKPLVLPSLFSMAAFFLVAMHYFQHNPGGSGLELSFNVAAWIPLSFAIAIACLEIARQKILRYTPLTLILLLACLCLTIPISYGNADVSSVLNRLFGLWAGLFFFIGLQQFTFTQNQRQKLLWLILGAVWIESLIGWVQFLVLDPGNLMGYDTLTNRPYGIFQQPNVMASFLSTGVIIGGYVLARIPMYRGQYSYKHLLLLITPLLTLPLLIVLGSRTGWLATVIGLLLLIPYLHQFAPKKAQRAWYLAIVLGLSLGWAATSPITNPNATEQVQKRTQQRMNLDSARAIHIPQAFNMFLEKPMMGYGYGTFEASYLTQTARWHHEDPTQPYGLAALDHPHNEILYWISEGGLLPLVGLALASTGVLWRLHKARKGTQLALIALLTPLALHSQLEYPFYHSIAHWVIFLILIYWIDNLTTKYHKRTLHYVLGYRVTALVVPILVSIFMITTLWSGHLLTKFETTKPINVDYLLNVNNPWAWQHRFEWDLYIMQLQLGEIAGKPELIKEYVEWATEKAPRWPRPTLYRNLILAQQLLGNTEQAQHIQQEAKFLFPNQTFLLDADIKPLPRVTP